MADLSDNQTINIASKKAKILIGSFLVLFAIGWSLGLLFYKAMPSTEAGTTTNWTGGGDGESWNDPLNWDTTSVPSATSDVVIDAPANVYVPSKGSSRFDHHWPLDDNAANTDVIDLFDDATGTASQNTSAMTTAGKVGTALDFNGSGDYISFGDLNTTDTDVISVSAWVNFDSTAGHQAIYTDGDLAYGFEFGLYNNELHIGIENANSHRSLGYSTAGLSTGTWYHVVAVADGPNGDLFIYLDNSLVASNTALTAFTTFDGTGGTYIGSVGDSSPSSNDNPAGSTAYYFNGKIDNVKVWKSKLNAVDVAYLYNSGSGRATSQILPQSTTIESLTLGNSGGTSTPNLIFAYNSLGSTNNLDISGGNLTVYSNAQITQTANFDIVTSYVDINVTSGTGTIAGFINLDYLGYAAMQGPGKPAHIWNGAGHGGTGGIGNISFASGPIVGSITAPIDLGSGGNNHNGGGGFKLNVSGNLAVNGTITANGGAINYGGAAGGSIYITTGGQLSGTGTIRANGGNGNNGGAAGAGGRIAIEYDSQTGSRTVTTYGGTASGKHGGAGTIYLLNTNAGTDELIIDNNNTDLASTHMRDNQIGRTPLTPSGTPATFTYDTLTIKNDGNLDLNSDTTISYTTLDWTTNGIVTDNGGDLLDLSTGGDPNDGLLQPNYPLVIPANTQVYGNIPKTFTDATVAGILRHSANNLLSDGKEYEINYILDNLVVTGSIDAEHSGYGLSEGLGQPVAQTNIQTGASYGGEGGKMGYAASQENGPIYGSITAPVDPGSGAVTGGGGVIRLDVSGNTVVNGTISADGEDEYWAPGSGGSVYITTGGELSGSGSITSNGGASVQGGSGGGGRIALEYDSRAGSVTTTAYADLSGIVSGGAGTVYLKDTTGAGTTELIIDNNNTGLTTDERDYLIGRTPLTPSGTPLNITLNSLVIKNEGNLDLNSDTTINYYSLDWTTNGIITDNGGDMFDLGTVGPNDGLLQENLPLIIPVGSEVYGNTPKIFTDATIAGTLRHSNNNLQTDGKVYEINYGFDNLVVSGSIDADHGGFGPNQGPGKPSNITYCGASYGGEGGLYNHLLYTTGPIYGSVTAPGDPGSGSFGPGGGVIRISVSGNTVINGTVTANGQNQHWGTGTGGSVYITTGGELSGSSSITSNGGASVQGGSGGGGRIALEYGSMSTPTITAYADETALTSGGAGTIYLKNTTAGTDELIIDNNGLDDRDDEDYGKTPLTPSGNTETFTFTTFTVQNGGHLDLNSDTTIIYTNLNWNGIIEDNGGKMAGITSGAMTIPSAGILVANTPRSLTSVTVNGTIRTSQNRTAETYKVNLTTSGDFIVNSGGFIDTDRLGYFSQNGPGAGSDRGAYGSGAGHGGVGGATADGNGGGGITYDSLTQPVNLGSGGGEGVAGWYGSDGGGIVRLVIGGNMLLDGTITSDGGDDPVSAAGGGSGGAVWVSITGQLTGSGSVTADGGNGQQANAGAGGGGRIAIYCGDNQSSVTTAVDPGSVGYTAGEGTVYMDECVPVAPPAIAYRETTVEMSREKDPTASVSNISFILTNPLAAGTVITIDFPDGFTNPIAPTGGTGLGVNPVFGTSGNDFTITCGTGGCAAGTITITGGNITTPGNIGSYVVNISNDENNDSSAAAIPILDDDTVQINADVDPLIVFDIDTSIGDGESATPYTVALQSLSKTVLTTSNHSTINSIFLDIGSNATNGVVVTMNGDSTGLYSPSTSNIIGLSSAEESITAGEEKFGVCVESATATVGTLTVSTQYDADGAANCTVINGGAPKVGRVETTETNIVDSSGAPVEVGRVEILAKASITATTPAANDYAMTLRFIATSTF